jgi:Phosphotransferase System HPr (HPr) Family
MIRETVTIHNPSGLHLRPAGNFCKECLKYQSDIRFAFKGTEYVAKSVLNVLSAAVKKGDQIELIIDGADEQQARDGIVAAVESGLGE